MKNKAVKIGAFIVTFAIIGSIALLNSMFVVRPGEYAVVKQFGKIVTIYEDEGLKLKTPFIQSVDTLPNKELIYDLPVSEVITKDKQTMVADSFALWRITDPAKFITNLNGSVANAENRIEMLVYNAMKNEISSRTQSEVISDRTGKLASDITSAAKPNFKEYGIELLAVETKHLDLPYDNKASVYSRMISERANISTSFAAEGEKNAQIIRSETDKEVAIMLAEAKAEAEQIRAEGEAEYMKILSDAYNNKSKADFYDFVRSLDAAKESLTNKENILVLDKDSPMAELFYQE